MLSKWTGALAEYVERVRGMAGMGPIEDPLENPTESVLGFLFAHPEVDTAIVGPATPRTCAPPSRWLIGEWLSIRGSSTNCTAVPTRSVTIGGG